MNAGRSPWSPLRGNETQTSPYRQTLIENERQKFYASAVNYGQTNNNNNVDSQEHTMDELRMRALLHAAIDAKDPVQRAASTPPTRLQLANPRSQSPDLDQAFNQMSMNVFIIN